MSEKFHFSLPEEEYLVQSILKSDLPQFEAHQDQLLGVCKVLNGVDLVVVTPTGSGKTGYIFMALVVMRAIERDPSLCSTISFPKDPIIVVICPTNTLEVQMICGLSLSSCKALIPAVAGEHEPHQHHSSCHKC